MGPIAVILFAALVWFGESAFGWQDYNHHVIIALVIAFTLGTLFGWSSSRQK